MHKSALKRVFLLALALLCLWLTAMCAVAASSKVKSLKLPSVGVVVKGNKLILKAKVSPAGTKITWKSSNKRIATVNTSGKVTGVGIGEATITATAGNKKAQCMVRVVKKKGMYKDKGKTYYCNPKTGLLAKGLTTIGSAKYYFHTTKGYMLTGLQKIKGKTYYFAPSSGKMQKGLQTIKKKLYFFDKSTGVQKTGMIRVNTGKTYNFLKKGGVTHGWLTSGSNSYYFHKTEGYMLTGLQKINDNTYYFHKSKGYMLKGSQTINKKKYYFDPATGVQKTGLIKDEKGNYFNFLKEGGVSKGLTVIGSDTYYFHESTGQMRTGKQTVNNLLYYFDKNTGKQCTGFISVDVNSGTVVYHFLKEGGVSKGFAVIDSNTYYFNPDTGVMYAGTLREIPKDSKKFYYFAAETGIMQTGFQTVNDNRYYFDPQTGVAATGITKVDGDTYYFNENNARMKFGRQTVNNLRYFFDEKTGKQCTGLVSISQDSKTNVYYYLPEGGISTGFVTVGSDTYYFNPDSGIMTAGKVREIPEGSRKFYYFAADTGIMQTGFQTVNDNRYYFDPETGKAATGITKVGGDTYYFNPDSGIMTAGKVREIPEGSKKYYYFAADTGIMQTGFQTVNDYRYYFDPQTGVAATGITKIDGDTYYFNENSARMKFGRQTVNNLRYFFDEKTGKQCTGLIFIDVKTDKRCTSFVSIEETHGYYYLPEGGVSTDFVTIGSDTYYFNPDSGIMTAGKVREIPEGSKKYYYFAADTGIMQNGFQTVGEKRYYFDPKTSVAALGLTDIDGKLYFFDENAGMMRTGLRVVNDKRYYFDPTSGQAINGVREVKFSNGSTYYLYFDMNEASGCRIGPQKYEGEYYCFHETGYFARSGFRTIDKSVYYFNPDNGYKANRNMTWNYMGVTLEANNEGVVSAKSDDGSMRSKVLRWAFNHVGHSYGEGNDQYTCSSFVSGAYEYAGKNYLTLKISKAENQAKLLLQNAPDCIKYPDTVPSDPKPGDLMFWEDPSCTDPNCDRRFSYNGKEYHIHHVSLYAGNNLVAEAANVELGTQITYMSDESDIKLAFVANVIDSKLPDNPEVDYSKFTTPSSVASNAMGSMEGQEDAALDSADEGSIDELSIGEDELLPGLLDLSSELDILLDDDEIEELIVPDGDLALDVAQNQDGSMEFELELP